jgi:YD repeat-containing protein
MKRKLLFFVLALACLYVNAQQPPNSLGFPSANNSFLGLIGNASTSTGIGVDQYTGTAQVNIPICNLGSREIDIPISLSYVAGRGVKLQTYSSNVGLGWQLNAGGNISRVVRGYPDERPNGFLGTGLWGQHIANWKNNGAPLSSQVSGISGISYSNPTADGEPDIFYIKTPFFSFQFVFDEFGQPVFSNNTGLKIITTNFYNSFAWSSPSFKVIDDQGNQYFFGTAPESVERTTATLFETSYTFPSTWYLDKIVTFNSKDVIQFIYSTQSTNEGLTHYQSTKTYLFNGCTNTNSTPTTNTIVQPKLVSAIWSANGVVYFNYAFDRRDIINSSRLTSIVLKSWHNSALTTLQTYGFVHSYFGDPSSNATDLRLKLDKITVAGNTPVTATPVDMKVFTYDMGANLPSRTSQSFDYWGYYTAFTPFNGSTDPMTYPQIRVPNENNAKANVLIAVKDMSGSSWQLDYELNSYFKTSTGTNVPVGGLRVKTLSQTLPTGENIQTTYSYSDASGNSYGQILTASYANLVNNWAAGVTQILSETPSNIYDINGTFVGYSSVKATVSNGGYVISNFQNFSDFQDVINYVGGNDPNTVLNISSSTSRAFKRGLLKTQIVYTASGNKILEETYNYTSLTSPAVKKSWGYHWYIASYNVCSQSGFSGYSGTYSTEVENFRVTQAIRKEYDQSNQASFVQSTLNYTYAANQRLMKTISTTNSKGNAETKTVYYPEDSGIPMLTATDQTAINNLLNYNKTNTIIHETTSKNGAVTQLHSSYEAFPTVEGNNVYLSSIAAYKGTTLTRQKFFKYDMATSNMISSYETNGKPSSYLYGYNSSYPIARADNASASSTTSFTSSTTYGGEFYIPGSITFTTNVAGTIDILLDFESSPSPGNVTSVEYYLTGPSTSSGILCYSYSGTACSGYGPSVQLPNMPAGTYTLNVYSPTEFLDGTPMIFLTIPTLAAQYNYTREFFFQDFEQGQATAYGNAHMGNGYFSGNYTVNFTLPNARSYVIQWWKFVNGVWQFNEQAYTGPTTLTGPVDDIRVFPSDAQMTSFAFIPLVGITGETDAAGRSLTYEYDGFSRLNVARDDDKNIIKKLCYSYTGQVVGCALFANTAQSGTYTKNNCSSGTGSSVTYTVPAGKYFSETSQTEANQQATNDVIANGQAYANQNGSCSGLINVVVTNSRPTVFAIQFTNTSNSSLTYSFSGGINAANSVVGQVPPGTYNVTIFPLFNTNVAYNYTVNGVFQSGTGTKIWSSMPVNCPTCAVIQIW